MRPSRVTKPRKQEALPSPQIFIIAVLGINASCPSSHDTGLGVARANAALFTGFMGVVLAVMPIFSGVFIMAASEALLAFRGIAINTGKAAGLVRRSTRANSHLPAEADRLAFLARTFYLRFRRQRRRELFIQPKKMLKPPLIRERLAAVTPIHRPYSSLEPRKLISR
ncbi:MAG: hypothetical protein AAGC44_11730 [Planctomycetota bacterium]